MQNGKLWKNLKMETFGDNIKGDDKAQKVNSFGANVCDLGKEENKNE